MQSNGPVALVLMQTDLFLSNGHLLFPNDLEVFGHISLSDLQEDHFRVYFAP